MAITRHPTTTSLSIRMLIAVIPAVWTTVAVSVLPISQDGRIPNCKAFFSNVHGCVEIRLNARTTASVGELTNYRIILFD